MPLIAGMLGLRWAIAALLGNLFITAVIAQADWKIYWWHIPVFID